MESRRHFLAARGAALAAAAMARPAHPQAPQPASLRIVVPWPPGQATDLAARVVGAELSTVLGQPVAIDNVPGSSGIAGTRQVAGSAPDGTTLLAASSGPVSFTPLLATTPYVVERDLLPLALIGRSPFVLVTSTRLAANDIREFIALVRSAPGRYSFASSGTASTSHLFAEAFNAVAGLEASHVPYKGAGPALSALVSGDVTYCFETAAATMPLVRARKLRAHGVSLARGSGVTPGVPSIASAAGLDFDLGTWIGLMVAARTPPDVMKRLGAAVEKAMAAPQVAQALAAASVELDYRPAEGMRSYLKLTTDRFREVIRKANIRLGEPTSAQPASRW